MSGISEFHYIAPVENLPSIFERGILSHNDAEPFREKDVSMDSVQEIRATKTIPPHLTDQVKRIHDCVNLYFNAKNPMLSSLRNIKGSLCVLRVRPEILEDPVAIISDKNAAVIDAAFYKAQEGLSHLQRKILFGAYWTSKFNTPEQNKSNGQYRCAELLLPKTVHPSYLGGMYVASEAVKRAVVAKFPGGCPVPITVHPSFFFDRVYGLTLIPRLSNTRFQQVQDFPPEDGKSEADESQSPHGCDEVVSRTKKMRRVMKEGEASPSPVSATQEKTEAVATEVIVEEARECKLRKTTTTTYISPQKGLDKWLLRKPSKGIRNLFPTGSSHTVELPPHITLVEGDLFRSGMQTLVNTVNCKGAMGKGIAKQFKTKFPGMFRDYKQRCDSGSVKPGVPYPYSASESRLILNFPTKDHWRKPSNLLWIEKGLDILVDNIEEWGITSIAIPPLGCGNGGLNWRVVRKNIIKKLSQVKIPVEIYQPK